MASPGALPEVLLHHARPKTAVQIAANGTYSAGKMSLREISRVLELHGVVSGMKTTIKATLTSIATIVGMALGAAAADKELVLVPNPHGQYTPLYRLVQEPTIAVNIAGRGLGNNIVVTKPIQDLTVTKRATGHGQDIIQYRSKQ